MKFYPNVIFFIALSAYTGCLLCVSSRVFLPKQSYTWDSTPIVTSDKDQVLVERGNKRAQAWGFIKDIFCNSEISVHEKILLIKLARWGYKERHNLKKISHEYGDDALLEYATTSHPFLKRPLSNGVSLGEKLLHTNLDHTEWNNNVVSILQELKGNGYPLAVATNQSEKVCHYLISHKNSPFSLPQFRFIMTSHSTPRPSENTPLIKKPDSAYFDHLSTLPLKSALSDKDDPLMIFIDDKRENVKACAQKRNCIGVHYDTHQPNADELLQEDLISLGLRIKRTSTA